jgi:integrase
MGLGPFPEVSLADGRAERDKWRDVLKTGADPIDDRDRQITAARMQVSTVPTFGQAADAYIETKKVAWRNPKHAAQWAMTMAEYAKPIRAIPVDKITVADILAALKPIWREIPETASRVRGRIEMIIDSARAHGQIDENRANPARWRGHLDKLLPQPEILSRGHHAAMPFKDVPDFTKRLRSLDSVGARALEFTILTAARTTEAMHAQWSEFDFKGKIWTVPPERMKAKVEHRVPLSPRAVEIVEGMQSVRQNAFVFPGTRPGKPLSNMTFDMLLRREKLDITAHGFRSSFRDWAGDCTPFPREVAEAALAHIIGSKAEQAYRRADALEKRRELMDAWARFLGGASVANVYDLAQRRAESA